MSTPILVLMAFFAAETAGQMPASLTEPREWSAGRISEQLSSDPTLVPFGKGAIFVPAMTNPLDEPPVAIWQASRQVAEGTTGKRILLLPGTYTVRIGSGAVEQRFNVQATVRELHTSVVPVSWSGLVVHVADEQLNSIRGSYELIRVEDREYIGIGFGSDEQAGEPVSTWILKPGLYKIVRVGETYRARRDFATVRLVEGELTHFMLVVDSDTNEFQGGGEVPAEELFQAERGQLWSTLILGGDLSLNSRQNVAGAVDGETYAARAFLDAKLSAELLGNPLIVRLQIEEGLSKTPDLPWQNIQDRADLDGLYVYRLRPWVGPYLRLSVDTNLLDGWQYFDEPTDIVILGPKGALRNTLQDRDELLIRPPLALTTIKEGLGMNVRLFKAVFGETTVRLGFGARHRITRDLLELDSGGAPLVFRRVPSNDQIGIEGTVLAVLRLTRWVVANAELDTLVPFNDTDEIIVDLETSLSVKLTRFASVNYVLRFLRDKTFAQEDQLQHDLRLRFSFEVF